MAAKKKSAKKTSVPKAGKGSRKCGKCGKRGHNSRSHAPGGRLAK